MKTLNYLALFWLLSIPLFGHAGNSDDHSTKVVTRSFSVKNGYQLDVNNKYGNVVVTTWAKDSVKFKIEITAFGKTTLESKRTLDRVEIDFDKSSEFISAESIFDRESSYFVELWNSLNDDSRALLSKSKVEVNYEIFIPKYLALKIENKYGDIILPDLDGKTTFDITHGNLRAGSLKAYSYISVGFGNIKIEKLGEARAVLKATDVDIKHADNLNISSNASEVRIVEVDKLRIDSRSDRDYEIVNVNSIEGNVLFTSIEVGLLTRSINLDMNYGDIRIENIAANFELLDLEVKSTDIDITLNSGNFLRVDIEGREQQFNLPLAFKSLEKSTLDEKKGIVRLNGIIGTPNNYPAVIRINSQGGIISILLNNQKQSVNK